MAQEQGYPTGYQGYEGYGGYGQAMDPATMRAKLAMAMLQQGSDSSPVRSPWQGAARMSNALFGALMMRQMQQSQSDSWKKALAGMPTAAGGGLAPPGGVPGGAPDLPAQPGALSDLANDPSIMRGVANAGTNGLPDSATIGQSLGAGSGPPPQMGPPMPAMAPNNAAGGMPPGYIGGGGGPGSMAPNMTAQGPRLDPRMMVAGPGAPSLPPAAPPGAIPTPGRSNPNIPLPPSGPAPGNGPQGAGAGFNPADLAMLQGDMQAVPGTPGGGGGGGGGFLDRLAQIESSNSNIYSKTDPDVAGPGTRSQGYFQINTPTWHDFAGKAGVDVNQYPNAMSAPRDVQAQVASAIPFGRFGPRTQNMLQQQYGSLPVHATIGQLAAQTSGGGGAPPPSALAFNGGQTPPPSSPALGAIQGAAGPPGGGPAPNNMFAQDMRAVPGGPGGPSGPQGQPPASMQPGMMVAGPGVPSGARGGAPPPMPPPGALGPPPGGGGNPLSAFGNMFGLGNPSGPQGGPSPAPAGGGAGGQANDPRFKALTEVLMDPYAAPGAKQLASQFLNYYMPHPTTWEAMPGTNNLAEKNWMGQFTGNTRPGPHQTSVVDAGTDFMGIKHQGVFDKDAPLGQQVTVIDPSTGRAVSPGQGGGVPPPSPTGSSVTPAAPGDQPAKVWSPGQPLDQNVDSKLQGLAVQYAGNDPRAQSMVYQYAKALLQGNQQFVVSGAIAKAPYIEAAETIARQVDPDGMPQTRFDTIKQNADTSSPTALGGQRMAAQTSVRHLGSLATASDLLGQQGQISGSEMAAKLQDWGMRNVGGASSKFTDASQAYNAALVPVLGEIDKLYKGGQATEGEIMEMKSNLSPTASPDARRAALTMLGGLLQDKVQVLQDTWHMGAGKSFPDLPIIDQQGQKGLDYIKNWGAGGGQGQPPPPGQWHAGGTPSGPIIPAPSGGGAQAAPAPQQGGADALAQARAAIAKGAPRAAVIQRLQTMGVNPAGL